MPLFPHAYAASLLKREEDGQTVFFPDRDNKRCYVVPNVEEEQRILRKLRRIRLAELAAWVLLVAVLIGPIAATDGAVSIPKWLFILGFAIAALAIELPSDWARRKLARNLALRDTQASKPSLLDRLPGWAVVVIIALAVGVALYLGRMWPLKTIRWLDDIPLGLHESKTIAKVAVFVAGIAAALWGGLSTVKRWFRPTRDHANHPNEEA
jgi:hypothetical protein